MVEDLFKSMASAVPAFAGLSLSKIGDLGVPIVQEEESREVPQAPSETQTSALPTPA